MSFTRRDFVSGFAVGLGALQLSPLQAIAAGQLDPRALGGDYYPPALTGLRGSHAGSFEFAHAQAMQGAATSLTADYRDKFANPLRVARLGYIDGVILPENTRPELCAALAMLASKRQSNPPRKHGNIPL